MSKALKFSLVVLLSLPLVSCLISGSRSYEDTQANASLLHPDALNIDRIEPVSFTVAATRPWQNTGVFMNNGDIVNITAHGSWSPAKVLFVWGGPDGNSVWAAEVPEISGGALIARVGHDGKPFKIGVSQTFRSRDYGMLYLAMNDSFNHLYDNDGEVTAEIYVEGTDTVEGKSPLDIVAYTYDAKGKNGSLSARLGGDHFKTRTLMIAKIGEIASSKNLALKAGSEKLQGGSYELLDESTADGILTINFRALW